MPTSPKASDTKALVNSPVDYVIVRVKAGDDHSLVFPVLEDGVVQDCTGWECRAQARSRSGELLQEWSTADGSIVCDADGVALLTNDSSSWTWAFGYFDVVATRPDGADVIPVEGVIIVNALRTQQ